MTQRVTIEELSRLMDGEVTDAQRCDIEARLAACPLSAALLARLETLNQTVTGATFLRGVQPLTPPKNDECLSEETILAVANNALATSAADAVEAHLVTCPHCLDGVLEALRTETAMTADRWPALPEDVRKAITPTPVSATTTKRSTAPDEWHRLHLSLDVEPPGKMNRAFLSGHLSLKLATRVAVDDGEKYLHVDCVFNAGMRPHAGQVVIVIDAGSRRQVGIARADDAGRLSLPPLTAGNYHLRVQNTPLRIALSVTA